MKKAEQAIKFIRSFAQIAEKNGEVVEVAYSGGKDSDVLLHLVRASGIKYAARYKSTTIDPPGTIKHVQEQGDVEILRPKLSFFEVVRTVGMSNVGLLNSWLELRFCQRKTSRSNLIACIR